MSSKTFQGIRTFCKVSDDQSLPYCVIGLPADNSASYRTGTRFGPSSIREASMILSETKHSKFVTDIRNYVADLGDLDLSVGKPEKVLEEIENATANVLAWNKHPVFLGGDHLVTLGIIRALNKKYGRIAVVTFDAHDDASISDFDDKAEHSSWLFSALSENLVDAEKVISIGVRHPSRTIGKSYLLSFGGTIFTARHAQQNIFDVLSNVKTLVGNTPVFLSVDLDVLDPAFAPGVGYPEIAGLSSMWLLECLESLWNLNWVGMDAVEVTPSYDHANVTSLAAATIVWLYLSMQICKDNVLAESQQDTKIEN